MQQLYLLDYEGLGSLRSAVLLLLFVLLEDKGVEAVANLLRLNDVIDDHDLEPVAHFSVE